MALYVEPYISHITKQKEQGRFLGYFINLNKRFRFKHYIMPKFNEMLLKLEDLKCDM